MPEAVIPLALDDFEKNRPDQGLSENLREVPAVGAVEQDAALLQIGDLDILRQAMAKALGMVAAPGEPN